MTFGEKLRMLRNENKLSQEKIAELVGVSRQAVSKWENDLSFPDTKKTILLADIFNISMGELLNLTSDNKLSLKDETKVINEKPISKDNLFVNIYLVLSPMILYFLLKRYIPETVPKHANIIGTIDAWGNNSIIFYLILVFTLLTFVFVYVMNKDKRYELGPLLIIIFLYINSISELFTTYQDINYTKNLYDISWSFERQFTFIIGLIFFIYGVFAHKIKMNFFIGLRTKWSMSSEEVWKQTHEKSRKYSLLTSGLNFFILLNPAIEDKYKLIISSISIILLTILLVILSYYEKVKADG